LKIFVLNYNGVLDGVANLLGQRGMLTDNYHEASAALVWQDVRGDSQQFVDIMKNRLNKPVFVMQHGRGATRDYLPPNSFKFSGTKMLVWGKAEQDRMIRAGVASENVILVGCPLFKRLVPKQKKDGVNILYCPVISSKEEPENIMVHAELKKWEAQRLQDNIRANYDRLKGGWATENIVMRDDKVWKREITPTVPRGILFGKGLINVKLSGVHDANQYMSPLVLSHQNQPNHVDVIADLLSRTDVLVCLEEGTMQLMAYAMDIPVVVIDIFKYGEYGGVKDYDKVEKIKTNAAVWIKDLSRLGPTLDHCLSSPAELRKNRISVCEAEGGAHLPDPDKAVVESIEQHLGALR
jgi:hypothetical protein